MSLIFGMLKAEAEESKAEKMKNVGISLSQKLYYSHMLDLTFLNMYVLDLYFSNDT